MEVLAKTQLGNYYFLHNDFIYQYILKTGKAWSYGLLSMVFPYVKEGDVVLDIGAHVGTTTVPLSKAVGEKGKVIAFEPQGKMMNLLVKNVELNECENVHISKMCVGHVTGETTIIDTVLPSSIPEEFKSRIVQNFGGVCIGKGSEKINMVALDDLEFDKLNLIKIDVEGAEKVVIWGARETIRKHRPVVIYETNKKNITENMIEVLELTDEIINFDIKAFFRELNYSKEFLHNKLENGDWIMIP